MSEEKAPAPTMEDFLKLIQKKMDAAPKLTEAQLLAQQKQRIEDKEAKESKKLRAMYTQWALKDLWKMRFEAIPLLCRIDPASQTEATFMRPAVFCKTGSGTVLQDQVLFEIAERAIQIGNLAAKNTEAGKEEWMVVPGDFIQFCRSKKLEIPLELSAFFPAPVVTSAKQLDATASATREDFSGLPDAQRRVLEARYTTPALDAAYAAIDQFWLKDTGSSERRATTKDVVAWLETTFGSTLSVNQRRDIDRMIRPVAVRKGGNIKLKPPTEKAKLPTS